MRASAARRGRSLVELLVCLGIIALMASMFLAGSMMLMKAAQNLGR